MYTYDATYYLCVLNSFQVNQMPALVTEQGVKIC